MLWIALVPLVFVGVAVAVVPLVIGMVMQQREARVARASARIRHLPPGRSPGQVGPVPVEPAA